MLQHIKRTMGALTPEQMARAELAEAELALLEAHSGLECATAMVKYHQARVTRLRDFLAPADPVPPNF